MNFGKYARSKKIREIHSKSAKVSNFFGSLFFKLLVFFIILAAIVGFFAGIGVLKGMIDTAPSIENLLSNITPEGYTTTIYDLDGNEVQQLHGTDANRIYVEYDQIPTYLSESFVAIEDERFWQHNGIDIQGILRAIVIDIRTQSFAEGASTITQQVIKNNVLDSSTTIQRKVQEMYLAVQLEKYKTKEEILELYMNTINCGNGTYGVQTASQLYFNKDVSELDIAESAVIAAITNNPSRYEPINHPDANRDRAVRVLEKLKDQGYITDSQYEEAYNEDVYSEIQVSAQANLGSSDYSYFVDETIDRLVDDLKTEKGYTETQAYNKVYSGGLSVYITQDQEMQSVMDAAFTDESNFPPQDEDYAVKLMYSLSFTKDGETENVYKEEQFDTQDEADAYIQSLWDEYGLTQADFDDGTATQTPLYIPQPQAAMVIIDYHTGYVKALTGGRGEKAGNRTFNRATQSERQPGSTFKVLAAYLPAIDVGGYTLATVIDDVPFSVTQADGTTYSPSNWYSGYLGLSTVREGIAHSMNILAVKTVYDIGVDTAFDYLEELGFTTLYDDVVIDGEHYTDKTLSLPLGGLTSGVTPLELTAAYGAIANGGVYIEPTFYTKVLDHDGNILLEKEPTTRRVMKETTAFLLTSAMESTITASYGTGSAASFNSKFGTNMAIAGKTGTTTSTKDLWFVGFTPYYVSAIWMGYDDPQTMAYVRSYHKYIWRDVMGEIHQNLEDKSFEVPDGIVQAKICTESGLLAVDGLCDQDPRGSTVRYEYFAEGTAPTEYCDVHKEVKIDTRNGLLATDDTPEEYVETKIVIERPDPLIGDEYTPEVLASIADHQYELPYNLEGEYSTLGAGDEDTDSDADSDVSADDEALDDSSNSSNSNSSTSEDDTDNEDDADTDN